MFSNKNNMNSCHDIIKKRESLTERLSLMRKRNGKFIKNKPYCKTLAYMAQR